MTLLTFSRRRRPWPRYVPDHAVYCNRAGCGPRLGNSAGGRAYLAACIRPDLAFAAARLARSSQGPRQLHEQCLWHLLMYLNATADRRLRLGGHELAAKLNSGEPLQIVSYGDADFANGADCKSVSGTCIFVKGSICSWSSRKQKVVADATYDAELMAMCEEATLTSPTSPASPASPILPSDRGSSSC